MKRFLLMVLALLVFAPTPAKAQVTMAEIFWLDPNDANDYAEFCRREYRIAVKQDGPKAAGEITDNQRKTIATIPTPETGQTPGRFWSVDAPEWWKRVSNGWPGSSTTGQSSQAWTISKFFEGLDSYQRVRATLRATALMYQSLKGLRFEVDAWQMMHNLLVVEEGELKLETDFDSGGSLQYYNEVPAGAVSVSIVPKGKEKWREIVKVFEDSPWDDPNHKIKWIGPTDISGIAIDATEVGGNPGVSSQDAMLETLQKIDAGARVAAEGLATVQMVVDQRKRQALNDAFSPKRLAAQVRLINQRIVGHYGSIMDLRSLLEGRSYGDIQAEYSKLAAFAEDEAKATQAQAELSANFYQNVQGQAANVVVELEAPERQKAIAAIEKEYEALFNLSSKGTGLIRDMAEVMNNVNTLVTSLFPAMIPYVGGILMPIDTAATIKGSADIADSDAKDPASDVQAQFRDARIRALAVRLNWILWEELRATRRLATIQETVAAANANLDADKQASNVMDLAAASNAERAAQSYRLRLASAAMERWGMGK